MTSINLDDDEPHGIKSTVVVLGGVGLTGVTVSDTVIIALLGVLLHRSQRTKILNARESKFEGWRLAGIFCARTERSSRNCGGDEHADAGDY